MSMTRYPRAGVMELYPDLQTAQPSHSVAPTRTAAILKPGIVLITLLVLTGASVMGLGVAAKTFSQASDETISVNCSQGLALLASSTSLIYIILHAFAAAKNDPVGTARPPSSRLHAACFIVARLMFLLWFGTFVASCVIVARPEICRSRTGACELQIIDILASIWAFVATGILLTALESCKYPFQTPNVLYTTKEITCRVNAIAEDLLNRSVSQRGSTENPSSESEKNRGSRHSSSTATLKIMRKPVPRGTGIPAVSSEPGGPVTLLAPLERPRGPRAMRSKSRGWGEEWTHLVTGACPEQRTRRIRKLSGDSGVSLSFQSSSEYTNTSGRRTSIPGPPGPYIRPVRPRIVTPSSNISNHTRRSPLSTMRSVEFPDKPVRPELRYCPPRFPQPHGLRPRPSSVLSQAYPTASLYGFQRRSSIIIPGAFPEQMSIRLPPKSLPPLPQNPPSVNRRNTVDVKVPGAFIDIENSKSLHHEQNLEEHIRKIEVEYVSRSPSKRNQRPGALAQRLDRPLAPARIDSRSRYRERARVHRTNTADEANSVRPQTPSPENAVNVDGTINNAFKRLTLGDVTPTLGKLFDLNPWD